MMKRLLILCVAGLLSSVALTACRNDPEPTVKQRETWLAVNNSSPFGQAMRDRSEILVGMVEDELRAALDHHGCPIDSPSVAERLFSPQYYKYVETVGRQWLADNSAFYVFTNGPLLHALEHLSDAEYQQSMDLLTHPDLQYSRTIADIRSTVDWLFSERLGYPRSGDSVYQKLAMLVEFKKNLDNTGHTDIVARAIGAIDKNTEESFHALPTTMSAPIDEKWIAMAQWFIGDEKREHISSSLLESVPVETVTAVRDYEGSPLNTRMAEAREAIYLRRTRASSDESAATEQELLGKDIIAKHLGPAVGADIRLYILYNHRTNLRRLAVSYIKENYKELCPTLGSPQRNRLSRY
ncbi:hypothetical protein [Bordetella genomosp. 4]|uniref:hypothetical protein n=1 Tax=Bordetella genomosp. 4 TaxID=463044 RepID=UPI001140924C|nr:hypothetical protein [Bordetella genomosp. 4]